MPGRARREIVRNGEIATYHCWSRCVQRAFLCGQDSYTGDDYDYRRDWIEKLLVYQAGVFAVDVGNHNVLSNHLHLIARTRPDVAATWSDEEVACRWKMAWPEWRPDEQRWVREPTDEEIELLLRNSGKLAYARQGLSNLSWFLARCKEPIARLANAEMNRAGHFWECPWKHPSFPELTTSCVDLARCRRSHVFHAFRRQTALPCTIQPPHPRDASSSSRCSSPASAQITHILPNGRWAAVASPR